MLSKSFFQLSFILTICLQHAFSQEMLKGKVIRISDGDTISILDSLNQQHRIRLYGIDCPEKSQDYYQVAKDYVGELCFQKEVNIQILSYDHYKRVIGKVYIDSIEINLNLLKSGLAWHFQRYDQSIEYASAEAEARLLKKEIWSFENPTPPWEFRKNQREIRKLKAKKSK